MKRWLWFIYGLTFGVFDAIGAFNYYGEGRRWLALAMGLCALVMFEIVRRESRKLWPPKPIVCPACGGDGRKALLGPFGVKACDNDDCMAIWGPLAPVAVAAHQLINPRSDGAWLMLYQGYSYWQALWISITKKREEQP